MANPMCVSPLRFYDKIAKQSHRKSYAYDQISPLITKTGWIPSFQFVIPTQDFINGGTVSTLCIYDAKTDELVYTIPQSYISNNISIIDVDGFKVLLHKGNTKLSFLTQGLYYLKISSGNGGLWSYYSEVFCFTDITKDCIEIEYWNETGNFSTKNGVISFSNDFHFKLLIKTEIGKPEYNFEEEGTKRLGYNFIESQVSKKIYKFNAVAPEYICDALRLVRLCDKKIIRCKDDEFDALSFEMDVEWQTQGDLASINCEFETDSIIVNLGGFMPDKIGGDYTNDEYNDDYYNQ